MNKINKKAIAGMLLAMVLSLGIMGGINSKKTSADESLQQGFLGWTYLAATTAGEGAYGTSVGCATVAAFCGKMVEVTGGIAIASGWNPLGWIAGGCCALSAL